MREDKPLPTVAPWRQKLWEIIFESDTRSGKAFDVALLLTIILSVGVVLLESTPGIDTNTLRIFIQLEIIFTLLFTLEYLFRIIIVRRPWRYIKSFYGIVDLMAILPTYISFFLPGAQYFLVVRILRLLRVFRILKLEKYLLHAEQLARALRSSRIKIGVFLFTIINIVVILGTAVYVIEGPVNGFTSIPLSIYWAVVTMTTVGYGDLVPLTTAGRLLATIIMLIGYGIIAVPTGIVSAEIARARKHVDEQKCPHCSRTGHEEDAQYCKYCGAALRNET